MSVVFDVTFGYKNNYHQIITVITVIVIIIYWSFSFFFFSYSFAQTLEENQMLKAKIEERVQKEEENNMSAREVSSWRRWTLFETVGEVHSFVSSNDLI